MQAHRSASAAATFELEAPPQALAGGPRSREARLQASRRRDRLTAGGAGREQRLDELRGRARGQTQRASAVGDRFPVEPSPVTADLEHKLLVVELCAQPKARSRRLACTATLVGALDVVIHEMADEVERYWPHRVPSALTQPEPARLDLELERRTTELARDVRRALTEAGQAQVHGLEPE